jgi:hypothetical protein
MLNIALLLAGTLVLAALLVAALRPPQFRVERSLVINAQAGAILDLIVDFHQWSRWSLYDHLDPEMRRTFEGAARGVGAVYGWSGNSKAGAGRMEILEVTPSQVVIQLDLLKPFEAHNRALFILAPQGDGQRLTWAMEGPAPFISRLMGLVFNMDRLVGRDFETGLASLKAVAEA